MGRYMYTPLDAAEGEIRLIRLLPGAFSDAIELEIFHVRSSNQAGPLNQDKVSKGRKLWDKIKHKERTEPSREVPPYEALSYVWGSQANPSSVFIRSKRGRRASSRLSLTENLSDALRYVRKDDEPRILWVDAICINQKDLVERSVQVARMGDIFRNASQVNVWLGQEAQDSNVAVDLVNSIAADLATAGAAEGLGANNDNVVLPDSETAILLNDPGNLFSKLQALGALCTRTWFNRLWIYQEYHLSRKAIAFIGKRTLNVRDLYRVLRFLRSHTRLEARLRDVTLLRGIIRALEILEPQPPGPLTSWAWHLIRPLKGSSCADARDRVYAILGLLDSRYSDEIAPDYTKATEEVFEQFFLCTLKLNGWANLSRCGQYGPEVSSWMPDLSSGSTTFDWCNASGKSNHEIVYRKESKSLQIPAVEVGRVAKVWFTIPSNARAHDTLEICRSQAPPNLLSEAYPLGGCMLDAYLCSIAGGKYHEAVPVAWYRPLQELRDLFQGGDDSEDIIGQTEVLFSHAKNRSVFSTTDGLLGICPPSVGVGDQIYVTPGVLPAVLLSNVPGLSNSYRIKGECYLHGFMNTEAFVGHLASTPSESAWGYHFQKIQGHWEVVFTNDGITTQDDPRLGSIPEGWKKQYWSEVTNRFYDDEFESNGTLRRLYFHNLTTNKAAPYDPRLTSKALRTRGVPIKDITIV